MYNQHTGVTLRKLYEAKLASFPGLSTIQFLITCSMQKQRPGPFYHVNDISVYVDRQRRGGVPDRKNAFRAHILCFEPGEVRLSLRERSKFWSLGQKLQDKVSSSFF